MNYALRDVLWLTNDQTDTAELLVQKLAETARITIPENLLTLRIPEKNSTSSTPLPLQHKRDILFFTKEALSNALKHSQATEITTEILLKNGNLRIKVEDNGIGFVLPPLEELERDIEHQGLKILHTRAERIKARYRIRSTLEKGTVIELEVKI